MFRPYTDLIKADIKWVRDAEHWQSMNAQAVPPRDESRRRRCWIDPRQSEPRPWPGDIWSVPAASGAPTIYDYEGMARDEQGKPILVSPDAYVLQTVYSQSALAAIKENSFMFASTGVPYTISKPTEGLAGYNFSSRLPAIDYPITVPTDMILVPGALARAKGAAGNYDVYAIQYQEFTQLCRPPASAVATPEQRIAVVAAICARTDFSAADKLQAVRKAVTDYGSTFA